MVSALHQSLALQLACALRFDLSGQSRQDKHLGFTDIARARIYISVSARFGM